MMCLWRNGNAVGCGPTNLGSIPSRHPTLLWRNGRRESFKNFCQKGVRVQIPQEVPFASLVEW